MAHFRYDTRPGTLSAWAETRLVARSGQTVLPTWAGAEAFGADSIQSEETLEGGVGCAWLHHTLQVHVEAPRGRGDRPRKARPRLAAPRPRALSGSLGSGQRGRVPAVLPSDES